MIEVMHIDQKDAIGLAIGVILFTITPSLDTKLLILKARAGFLSTTRKTMMTK
jgi:hypothetical protein